MFDAEPAATPAPGWTTVTHLDRDVGRVTSLAWVPEAGVAGGGLWVGLAPGRRGGLPRTAGGAAGRDAPVVELPLAPPVHQARLGRFDQPKSPATCPAARMPTG